MARVLEDTGAGSMLAWEDETGIRSFVEQAWTLFHRGGIPAPQGNIDQYTRQHLTRELAALLDSVL